jgi:glutamate-1-semialdehyde 2,1-aminomutase
MNTGGAHLVLGISPDIAVFSKALGNGYPIGAIIGKANVMEAAQKSFISSTYWTERIGPTAAIATLKKHKQLNAGDHLMKIGRSVQEGWKKLGNHHRLQIHIGGIPPLSHFSFDDPEGALMKALFVQLMLEEGFLASTSFYSMAAHQEKHVTDYLNSVDKVFGVLADLKKQNKLETSLKGRPSVAGFKRLT